MTYTSGSLIVATDYNGFVNDTVGANVNNIWSTGATDAGYGQTAISTVSAAGTITATQWASLVNNLASMGSHQGTTITSRSAPTAGNTINILAALNTDLTACTTNRGNAAASGSQFTGWTGTNSKTTTTTGAFTITFTNTVTFATAAAARYFWNAGGLVKIQVGKSATGQTGDPEWNDLATTLCGAIWISGRVNGAAQTIAGVSYTGTKQVGGTGVPNTLATTTGWYTLTAGGAATIVYKQFADSAPYTANYIQHTLAKGAGADTLVISTTWVNAEGDTISGGTAASGATVGTAPCTIVTYYPPSATYLTTAAWGTPSVAATTA
jgi:hypothetical protein